MKSALTIGVLDFVYCIVFAINMRAIAQGRYARTFITDLVLGAFAFSIVKLIAAAKTPAEMLAYCFGGAAGACVGIWFTREKKA
jgi:hypothetical protein